MTELKTMTAKRTGTCGRCLAAIDEGQSIEGLQGVGWRHTVCPGPVPPFARQTDLDRIVAHLRAKEAAGQLNTFTASVLSQATVKGRLSDKQMDGILRKLDDRPLAKTAGRDEYYANLPGRDIVPAGRYCLERASDGVLYFVRVWRPPVNAERITGFAKAYLLFGPSETTVKVDQVLEAIIKAGPAEAAIRYGREICHCCICNARLTNHLSRMLGIGPVCGGRFYDPDAWKATKKSARAALRTEGIDPESSVGDEEIEADVIIARRLQEQANPQTSLELS